MTSTKSNPPKPKRSSRARAVPAAEQPVDRAAIKRRLLTRRLREAQALASRMTILPDGSRVFLRFDRAVRSQHLVLMVTFTTLAVTGLLQHFSHYTLIAKIVNGLGGVEALRTVHHVAAILIIAVSLYHVWTIFETWFVKRTRGAMWPRVQDAKDLVQIIKYNLGLAEARPAYDRFSIEEKMEYWALLWGQSLMIVTGLIMWFPVVATWILPGEAIPIARALHSWEAILATLAILTWHTYHAHIKTHNRSMFTGYMTEEEMRHEHPLEYERILAAYAFIQKVQQEHAAARPTPSGNGQPASPDPAKFPSPPA